LEGNSYQIDNCGPQIRARQEGKIDLQALSKGHYPGKRMNFKTLPGLASVGFLNCRGAQDWGLEPHRNEGVEIVFLETGGMVFVVDDNRHVLRAGHLTVTRPWQLHKLGDPHIGSSRLHWLILDVGVRRPNQEWKWPDWIVLDPRDLRELTRKLRHGEQSVWMATHKARCVFRDIASCVTGWGEAGMVSRLAVAVNQLMIELLEVVDKPRIDQTPELSNRRHTVELFLKDLAENSASASEPWTLEKMAEHCSMGITAITKYCRERTNSGPVAYLNQCRLEHAAERLRSRPELSITEIAMWAGFNSSQYFAMLFRKRYHTTPMLYRRKASEASVSPHLEA
jgi:AraC family L-rhamnose operon regulatory protein RhaS